jgi:hypothetical protein
VHVVDIGAVIPRIVCQRTVLMTMALTARNQTFARQWCSALGVKRSNERQVTTGNDTERQIATVNDISRARR